jgi:predicted transcriptional regulator
VIGNIRLQLMLAREVLHLLEVAEDSRPLVPHEESLRQFVKLESLRLASLERTLARQESRLLWIRK